MHSQLYVESTALLRAPLHVWYLLICITIYSNMYRFLQNLTHRQRATTLRFFPMWAAPLQNTVRSAHARGALDFLAKNTYLSQLERTVTGAAVPACNPRHTSSHASFTGACTSAQHGLHHVGVPQLRIADRHHRILPTSQARQHTDPCTVHMHTRTRMTSRCSAPVRDRVNYSLTIINTPFCFILKHFT